jgi:hypothetical protein
MPDSVKATIRRRRFASSPRFYKVKRQIDSLQGIRQGQNEYLWTAPFDAQRWRYRIQFSEMLYGIAIPKNHMFYVMPLPIA